MACELSAVAFPGWSYKSGGAVDYVIRGWKLSVTRALTFGCYADAGSLEQQLVAVFGVTRCEARWYWTCVIQCEQATVLSQSITTTTITITITIMLPDYGSEQAAGSCDVGLWCLLPSPPPLSLPPPFLSSTSVPPHFPSSSSSLCSRFDLWHHYHPHHHHQQQQLEQHNLNNKMMTTTTRGRRRCRQSSASAAAAPATASSSPTIIAAGPFIPRCFLESINKVTEHHTHRLLLPSHRSQYTIYTEAKSLSPCTRLHPPCSLYAAAFINHASVLRFFFL